MKKNSLGKEVLKKMSDKKVILLVVIVILLLILILILKGHDNNQNENIRYVQDTKDPLSIGETKYLEFLWMVDGAFNYERYNKEDFKVNGKTLERKPDFTCTYDKEMKTCVGHNFEEAYNKLFAKSVNINRVYGDGAAIRWYEKIDGVYTFTNVNSCDAGRMSTNQQLEITESDKDKIICKVTFDEELKSGIYKGKHHFDKEFVLVKENDTWKVSKAYYHNPCYMEHNVN